MTSIKQEIIKYLEGQGGWRFGGQIDDYIRDLFGSKAGNVGRRCRELAQAGTLEASYVQIDGKGPHVVRYRINKEQPNFDDMFGNFLERT